MISTLVNALKLKEEIPEGWYEFSVLYYYYIKTNNKEIIRIKIQLDNKCILFYDFKLNDVRGDNTIHINNFFEVLGFDVDKKRPYNPDWFKQILFKRGQLYLKWIWYISAEGVVGYQPEITFEEF